MYNLIIFNYLLKYKQRAAYYCKPKFSLGNQQKLDSIELRVHYIMSIIVDTAKTLKVFTLSSNFIIATCNT